MVVVWLCQLSVIIMVLLILFTLVAELFQVAFLLAGLMLLAVYVSCGRLTVSTDDFNCSSS